MMGQLCGGTFLRSLDHEKFAFWIYTLGVATTAFGPIAHYIGWVFALSALIYGRIRYQTPLSVKLDKESRRILVFLILFLAWSMFAHVPSIDSFYVWGKGASIPLEFMTGLYLAMRLIDTPEKRKKFGLAVIAVNAVFCYDVMFRPYFHFIGWNASLDNGNAVALYALFMMPIFFCYAFWVFEKNSLLKYFLCLTSMLLVVFSFSSGGWSAAALQALIFVFYAIAGKRMKFRSLLLLSAALILVFILLLTVLGRGPFDSLKREYEQIISFNDLESFTTHRTDTWRAAVFMAKDHLVGGCGWATFEASFEKNRKNMAAMLKYKWPMPIAHPHSMYLSILYAGGLPSLLFFMAAFLLSLKRSWPRAGHKDTRDAIPWRLICFMLLASQVVYGTNGDVFAARRDIAAFFWACWGLLLVMPIPTLCLDRENNDEDTALCR